ncbi:S-layer homology domain-containing protein [Cohnella pontilimi]|uniref:S-layer homology domain-containing protein n=1 Tax=Cohnella pontilimi TaxID=2564100 RepID=A0A4U0F702_9BACL|nr:S-layer homology domain-containing protein [Cohnella pontilimi]TJY39744.1 S-layer homology domain-containing protein [Cohnella pontilimi]
MMRKWHGTVLIVIAMIALLAGQAGVSAAGPEPVTAMKFKDIEGHWAKAVIEEAAAKGIVAGFPDGTFGPNDSVTVAQFIVMMYTSMAEKDESGNMYWAEKQLALVPDWFKTVVMDARVSFKPGKPWYASYVENAKIMGVIRNNEYAGRYNELLTRERAAAMIYTLDSYFHGNVTDEYAEIAAAQLFKDMNRVEENYYLRSIGKVAARGIMNGNKGFFNPKAAITRAEAVQITSLLADSSKRNKVNINLNGVPYAVVNDPGFDTMVIIFANQEMKKVYDSLLSSQSTYEGSTDAHLGVLGYYENDTQKEKELYKEFYMDFSDSNNYGDMSISFVSRNYNIALETVAGRAERASKPIYEFLSLVYKNPEPVKKLIDTAVASDRNGNSVNIEKTFEGRDILIVSNGRKYLQISVGAYGDK